MNNQQPTTPPSPEAPEQPMLPGIEPEAETRPLGSVSKTADELAEENQALRSDLRMRTAIYDVETRLAKAGARTPDLIAASAKDRFQFDDEGNFTNAEAILDDLRRKYPEQFTPDPPPSIDASAGRSPRPAITKEALARMKPEEINNLDWAEVKATLSSG